MTGSLLICTDLDRTLIPNGKQPESPTARKHFSILAADARVTLVYVSGRHRALVEEAISNYQLPVPDYVIGDVGTSIYRIDDRDNWQRQAQWEREYRDDWGGHDHGDLKTLLDGTPDLRIQEWTKQNVFKLSYYVPLSSDREALSRTIGQRLSAAGARCNLIWSTDEPRGIGLLDILPARASKYHAIENVMRQTGFNLATTVFCGDSGNDIEVLASPVPAVLVANAEPEVRELATELAARDGHQEQLYLASGGFYGMNGNYAGGMLEGIARYHPDTIAWMSLPAKKAGNA